VDTCCQRPEITWFEYRLFYNLATLNSQALTLLANGKLRVPFPNGALQTIILTRADTVHKVHEVRIRPS